MRQVAALGDICVKYISSQLSSLSVKDILLPDELYIKILQHLRNQGLLSSASLSLFLISKIHSINFTSCVQINDECIQTICKMCPNIQNLVLSKCPMITDQGIQTIGTTCLGVKLLHISKCFQVTDAAFTYIFISSVFDSICTLQKDKEAKPLGGLIELDVSGTKITDDTVVHSCPELKLLDLSDCNITVKSIEVIEEKLPGLKMLRASGCHLEYGTCLSRLPSLEGLVARQCPLIGDSAIIDLINNASSLSSLDLQWSGITDATINELNKIDSKLVSLRLSWCSLVGESALANLLKNCVNLQTLDLSWRSLHDDTLSAVTSNCTRLKLLDISGCNELSSKSLMECGGEALEFLSLSWCRGLSDAAFKRIVERSPNLKTLDMSLCNNITPNTLATLAQCTKLQALLTYKCIQFTNVPYVDLFKNLPELTIVNLSECHITDLAVIELAQNATKLRMLVLTGCKGVTSKSLVALAQNCNNLESVNVSSTNVDDVGVSALAASCGGLVSLGLSGCKAISNISILAIASHSRVLQQIYLSYCPSVTEASLIQLAQKCAYLQVVELSNCTTATDALICEITMHSPLLQVLNVSGCHGLTDSSIDYLWLYGQHLTSLDVSRCPAITATALSSFSTLMPHVNIRKNGY